MATSLVDPKVFEDLQTKLDDDAKTREQIRDSLQALEKEQKSVLSVLSSAHSIAACMSVPETVQVALRLIFL